MLFRIYLCPCAAVIALLTASPAVAQKVPTAGYLPHWEMGGSYFNNQFEDQVQLLDNITYFGEFRFRPDGTIAVGNDDPGGFGGTAVLNMPNVNNPNTWTLNTSDSRISRMPSAYNKVANVSPSTTTTFTIGGWGNSHNFHVFTDGSGAGSKAAFAAQQVRKILDLSGGKLTGIDLDWEDGGGCVQCPAMEINAGSYGNLTTAIRNTLQPGETQTSFIQHTRYNSGAAIIGNLDSLRLATYDAPDASGNHTSLASAAAIANSWMNHPNNYDKAKLSIGSGFYGRTLTNPFGGPSSTFSSLDASHRSSTGQWLDDADTVYNGQGFDGPDSIAAKIDFIRDEGLNEIFAWELANDNRSTILDSLGRSHYLALTQAMNDAAQADPIAGDFDGNGVVDGVDLAQWEIDYGVNGNSDADSDGDSDGFDFLTWQQNLTSPGGLAASVASVPEPDSLALVVLGLANCCVGRQQLGRTRC